MIYIYTHQGLGDHIICNGIVRHFVELHNRVAVFCKPHNEANVKWMYRDDPRIHVLAVGQDQDTINYIISNNLQNSTILVGFDRLWKEFQPPVVESFDEAFYKMINLPFEYRFTKFKIQRDQVKEKECFDYVNPNNEPYIFVHGNIDRTKVRTDLKIIENPTNYGVFDILSILENAEELHLMESSIKALVNSLELCKPKIFYHDYVRGYDKYHTQKTVNQVLMTSCMTKVETIY
jgi:hypothetical protein